MRQTTLATVTAAGLVSIVSSQAQAQTVANALQIGLGTDIISYSSSTLRVTAPAGPAAAAGATTDYKSNVGETRWGVSSHSNVSLDVGYGLNDNFVVGGVLVFGGWTESTQPQYGAQANAQRSTFSFFIGPKLDYLFLPDSRVRPFVGAVIGLARNTDNRTTSAANVTVTQSDETLTGLGLLGRVGIRWFLTPGFSIDPALSLGFHTLSGSATGAPAFVAPTVVPGTSYDSGLTGYSIGFGVTASGWVGL